MGLTVAQVAEILNVSETRVRVLCAQKRLKAVKFGKRVWDIDSESVENYRPLAVGNPRMGKEFGNGRSSQPSLSKEATNTD